MANNLSACVKEIKKESLDAILVSDPINITYLTSFKNPEGYLLITVDGKLIYFTSPLYKEEVKSIKSWKAVISVVNIFNDIKEAAVKLKLKSVGFESKHLPFLEHKKIKELFAAHDIYLIETTDFIKRFRVIKKPHEISLMRKAARVSLEALEYAEQIYDVRKSEKSLQIEIERFLRLKADDEIAFSPIVAAGKNSCLPHHKSGSDKLNSKICLIDLGSKHYGYCADLTRVFFWGKMPPYFKRIYNTVLKAKNLSIKKIKDGVRACDVDKAARDFIEKQGYGKYFTHGVGHGIGLSVHEPPFLNRFNTQRLKEGMVVTIEPAVYLSGKFGIRLEDMVLVKKNKAEILSSNGNR